MISLEVEVEADGWDVLPDAVVWCQRAAEAAVSVLPEPTDGSATLLLTDDESVRTLNRDFRGLDKPTNVLSFPAPPQPGRPYLGDIAIAFETVAGEATAETKTLADHTAHLVIHGILHLLGHDHETDPEADAMERLEVQALAQLGIGDPYHAQA